MSITLHIEKYKYGVYGTGEMMKFLFIKCKIGSKRIFNPVAISHCHPKRLRSMSKGSKQSWGPSMLRQHKVFFTFSFNLPIWRNQFNQSDLIWSLPNSSCAVLAVIFAVSLRDVPGFHLHPTPSLISLWSLCISRLSLSLNSVCSFASSLSPVCISLSDSAPAFPTPTV